MKRFVLNPKPYIITSMFAILFLFSTVKSFGALKTWAGGTGAGKNWTTPANWGGTAPAAGDDILFNTAGTITFSTMPASVTYGSLTIQQGTVTLIGGAACTLTLGSAADPDFEIFFAGDLTIGTNVNITLAASAFARISGNFTINAGSTYNTDGTSVVTTVFAGITNKGSLTCATASKLLMNGGAAYFHSQNAGTIPSATWDFFSTCSITGMTTTHPAGGNQAFGSLTYDCPGMTTTNIAMPSGLSVANGFSVNNTGTFRLLMTAGSFTVGGDFNLPGAGNFTISGTTDRTLTVLGGVFITGGNLDLCSGLPGNVGTLNVGGNFNNFGAITETGTGKGVINFNGTTAQNFNQSGALVNNVDFGINNSAGVTFTASTTINGALTLTNGILNIPAANTLTIASGNAIGGSGFSATKHINTQVAGATHGFLQVDNMVALGAYTFPMGNGTSYLPIILTPATTSSFSVGVFTGITENGLPNGLAFTPAKKAGVVDAVWTINRNSGTSADMTLAWPAALEGATFATYTTTQIGISHWDGPNWGTSAGTGNNSLNTATRSGVSVFSPFGVGKTPYLLPVKFSYLNAAKGNGYNTLNWKAACNSTEVTFSIERSTDGRNFTAINSITASQSRCAQPFDYVDNNSLSGTVFYRIRSTEITGTVTYSNIVKVTDQQKDMLLTAILPNPVMDQAQLSISTAKKDVVDLIIVSMEGKIVQRSSVQLQAGSSIINLDLAALQKGMYMIKGTFSNGQTSIIKFTKQ
ncbi:MAG: T9SS type A sorting domain-containing protein [Ferruginibacter sp.]